MRLEDIRIDGGTQPRKTINENVVQEYAEEMDDGAIFPPVDVFFDGVDHWLADGFHRYHAHRRLLHNDIVAEIHKGTRRDAVLYSAGANADHGMRRTNTDKRRSVTALLEDGEWSQWSDREIARRCRVSNRMVGNVRSEVITVNDSQLDSSPRTYKDKHGNTSTMDTANIGKSDQPHEPLPQSPELPTLGPPADGLQYARMAIANLERIQSNDIERGAALTTVSAWIEERI